MTDSLDAASSTSQSHTASCMQTSEQQLNPQIDDAASPHLPWPPYFPIHTQSRPEGAVHVCFSESDQDFSSAVIRDLRDHGHDVTDCQRSPVPGQPELRQMAALVQSAAWVVGVVSLAAQDSIWLTMQLQWALHVAVDRGVCQLILVLQPDVNLDLLPPLLDFFPNIWTANEGWTTELLRRLSGRPTPLADNHRRLIEEQAFLCGAQASLWPSLSTPSLDRASSLESLDSRPKVPRSLWPRFLQRTRRSLLTSRDQAVASLTPEDQHLASEQDSAELQTEGAVHFLHREEDEGHVREVKGWLESEGVRCTDSGLCVRPGDWELPQLQTLVTCAAWVVVMVTLGSLDSLTLDLLCQVACVEACRRGRANVVVVLAHHRLRGLLPRVLSPFPTLLAADGEDWRSRLKALVTSLPPPLSREEVSRPGLGTVQRPWKAASACSLERQPGSSTQAVSTTGDSVGSWPVLPLWLWPRVASRRRKAQLKTAAEDQVWENRTHCAGRIPLSSVCAGKERSAAHVKIYMNVDDNDGVTHTEDRNCKFVLRIIRIVGTLVYLSLAILCITINLLQIFTFLFYSEKSRHEFRVSLLCVMVGVELGLDIMFIYDVCTSFSKHTFLHRIQYYFYYFIHLNGQTFTHSPIVHWSITIIFIASYFGSASIWQAS